MTQSFAKMNCDTVDFLREAFPKIDVRIIKATVFEDGEDVDSALSFLRSIAEDELDEVEDASPDDEGIGSDSALTTTADDNAHTEPETVMAAEGLTSSNSQVSLASLEEIIEDAKKDKQSVINLVKEVSDLRAKADQERAAAVIANIEAANSGEDSLKKAEELRRKISEKKQYNLSRVGEIYGEKAVLATEAQGLKLRLEQVKLQKERTLTTLNEIKARLQGFYEEALRERMEAEERRREREKFAEETLAAEEEVMAMVEEESKKLDMDTEACLQLKAFLSHHGGIIDSLQGEICVLLEDVESFKRQVDDNMWSSLSTVSLPLNINPEGPYSFRKCSTTSTSSSQEMGQSFDALCSRMSGLISKEVADCVTEPASGSCRGADIEFSQQLASLGADGFHVSEASTDRGASSLDSMEAVTSNMMVCSWNQEIQNSGSHLWNSRGSDTSNVMGYNWYVKLIDSNADCKEAMSSDFNATGSISQFINTSVPSSRVTTSASRSFDIDLNRSVASSGTASLGFEFTDSLKVHSKPADSLYVNHFSSQQACDDWIVTQQMAGSGSSTSSSLVKVEAHDYLSD